MSSARTARHTICGRVFTQLKLFASTKIAFLYIVLSCFKHLLFKFTYPYRISGSFKFCHRGNRSPKSGRGYVKYHHRSRLTVVFVKKTELPGYIFSFHSKLIPVLLDVCRKSLLCVSLCHSGTCH